MLPGVAGPCAQHASAGVSVTTAPVEISLQGFSQDPSKRPSTEELLKHPMLYIATMSRNPSDMAEVPVETDDGLAQVCRFTLEF